MQIGGQQRVQQVQKELPSLSCVALEYKQTCFVPQIVVARREKATAPCGMAVHSATRLSARQSKGRVRAGCGCPTWHSRMVRCHCSKRTTAITILGIGKSEILKMSDKSQLRYIARCLLDSAHPHMGCSVSRGYLSAHHGTPRYLSISAQPNRHPNPRCRLWTESSRATMHDVQYSRRALTLLRRALRG